MDTLINWETQELNITKFKHIVPKLKWVKKITTIGIIEEAWYRGDLENEEKKIKVVVRPSMRMQVTETYKNLLPNGVAPQKQQRATKSNPFVDYGCSTQVSIDKSFIKKIDTLAEPFKRQPIQKVSWD